MPLAASVRRRSAQMVNREGFRHVGSSITAINLRLSSPVPGLTASRPPAVQEPSPVEPSPLRPRRRRHRRMSAVSPAIATRGYDVFGAAESAFGSPRHRPTRTR